MIIQPYDIVVVGGGHAGCEAAVAAARLGSRVLLITLNVSTIAQMSCNPAMGGIAKGQIVREIDALGGKTGLVTDHTMVQFRMLNLSKGPAMWSPRAQSDRHAFSLKWQQILQETRNLDIWQDAVMRIVTSDSGLTGVETRIAGLVQCHSVIVTSGTFLNGRIHIGTQNYEGGRLGEENATELSKSIAALGVEIDNLKTGTPVRVDGRSIDFSMMTEQKGDDHPGRFSYLDTPVLQDQLSCYLTYTNKDVHDILREGFEQSPLFAGRIKGSGPRYCPSIEDKIERFSSRERHQLFVEPEGRNTQEYYVNGFSSSLPLDVQYRALTKVPGFEHARIVRPGYAIEYDYFPPTQLTYTLESKHLDNLYFAGQVNGTTGYEEAACQGLMAGINAHRKRVGEEPVVLSRSEAYIGVLIDDLVTKGTKEPYRMFTSRAEFRILLRQDNADVRLTPIGHRIGLAGDERMTRLEQKHEGIAHIHDYLEKNNIAPEEANPLLAKLGTSEIVRKVRYAQLVLRPQVSLSGMISEVKELQEALSDVLFLPNADEIIQAAEIEMKYKGYLVKERELAEKITRLEEVSLGKSVNYNNIPGLSNEALEKLNALKPETVGQASRISGINPSDVSVLLVYLGR